MSSIFIEWMKEAITELSFAKRETIHQSSNSSISNASNSSSIPNDYSSPLPAMDRQDENREVTDFFGWAIQSLRRVLSKEYSRMKELQSDTTFTLEQEEEMISFLDGMRIHHTEAILDKQYLHECYPSFNQLKTLVVTCQQSVFSFREVSPPSNSLDC
jgi:hypothetical protein